MFFNRSVLEGISGRVSISRKLLPRIMREGCVAVHEFRGLWKDIGVPEDYMRLNWELLTRKYPKGFVDETARVGESATLREPFFVGGGSEIGRGGEVGPFTVIGKRDRIGENVYIKESVVMDRVEIDMGTYINGSIIANSSRLGRWNYIGNGTVLGEEMVTEDGVMMNSRTKVLPYKIVKRSILRPNRIII